MTDAPRHRLFVIGGQESSRRAIENAKRLGEVEVLDLRHAAEEAERSGVLATPLLIAQTESGAVVRIVGDLMDIDAVLARLGLDIDV